MPFISFSHVFLGGMIPLVSSPPLLDFISKAFSHTFLFQFSLIQNRQHFQHHFNRWDKQLIQRSRIHSPKSQNLLAAELGKKGKLLSPRVR